MSNAPGGWGQVLMSNPHLRCGDARGWGVGLEIDRCIIDSPTLNDFLIKLDNYMHNTCAL